MQALQRRGELSCAVSLTLSIVQRKRCSRPEALALECRDNLVPAVTPAAVWQQDRAADSEARLPESAVSLA